MAHNTEMGLVSMKVLRPSTSPVHGTVPSSTSTVFLGAVKYLRTLKSLYSLMVSKTRADDYKIQIQRFRDQPEIFYLELTWFSKSPSPASPTLPCASPSHLCSTYTYPSMQRRSRNVTVTRCSNVDGEIVNLKLEPFPS